MSFVATIKADIGNFENGISKATKSIDGLQRTVEQRLVSVGNSMQNIGAKATILSVALVGVGTKAFTMAADFQDAMGATDQVFKDSSEAVKTWAENLNPQYGIAKKEALSYSNMMGSMLVNIGNLTDQQASKQSAKLIELAGDLTAMYGGTTQDAVRALTGALKGNNTMLDNYGMAVNDAMVKAKALELGLIRGTGEMTLQAKQAATLALIWQQTGAAQGQAAREADGASGAMRIFKAEITNLTTELGEVLLPVITPFISKLAELTSSLRNLSPEMKSMIVSVAAVTAVVGPALLVLGKVLTLLPLIKVAIGALTGPIGAVIAVVAIMAANFGHAVERMKGDAGILESTFESMRKGAVATFNLDFRELWNVTANQFSTNLDFMEKKLTGFLERIGVKVKALGSEGGIGAMAGAITGMTEQITKTNPVVDDLTKTLTDLNTTVELDTFQKLIGEQLPVQQAIEKTALTIENLQSKLVKLQLGILTSTNVRQEIETTQKQINDLSTALNSLTGIRELKITVDSGIDGIAKIDDKFRINGEIVIQPIDTSLLEGSMGKITELISVTSEQIGSLVSNGIISFAQSIGEAFSGNWEGLGAGLLKSVGQLAQQFGGLVIGMAIAAQKLREIIVGNPMAAIAAGVALVALGAAAAGAAQRMISKGTGGGASSGYSGGAGSYGTGSTLGTSDYRGQYQDDFKVEFKIGTNELVAVLDTAQQRRNRL